MAYSFRRGEGSYRQNYGKPGVVYVLENPGLQQGLLKIGCSTHSGAARARQLNSDANTGTPGEYHCVFECRSQDCGEAEGRVFKELAIHRRGKWGQEFFLVPLERAKELINQVCTEIDRESEARRSNETQASRANIDQKPIIGHKLEELAQLEVTALVQRRSISITAFILITSVALVVVFGPDVYNRYLNQHPTLLEKTPKPLGKIDQVASAPRPEDLGWTKQPKLTPEDLGWTKAKPDDERMLPKGEQGEYATMVPVKQPEYATMIPANSQNDAFVVRHSTPGARLRPLMENAERLSSR